MPKELHQSGAFRRNFYRLRFGVKFNLHVWMWLSDESPKTQYGKSLCPNDKDSKFRMGMLYIKGAAM
jgi:hypothetical protein